MSERGLDIVVEGGDGTGKTTQILELAEQLSLIGRRTLLTLNADSGRYEPIQEPGGTAEANRLRYQIKDASIERTADENMAWFTDARASNNEILMQPALDAGIDVLRARSHLSTIAYQGYGEGLSIKKIEDYTRERVGEAYMHPDIVIILALTDESVRRGRWATRGSDSAKDTFESMHDDFHERTQAGYIDYALKHNYPIIDANQSKEKVFDDIWAIVEGRLLERGSIKIANHPMPPVLYNPDRDTQLILPPSLRQGSRQDAHQLQ